MTVKLGQLPLILRNTASKATRFSMPAEILSYASLFTLAVGLIAGTVGGVVGTGSSIMLLPVLVWSFGPKQAVPIMAVAAVMANLARLAAWWREVDWRAFLAYGAAAALVTLVVPFLLVVTLRTVISGASFGWLAFPLLAALLPTLFASFYASYRDVFATPE